MSGYDRTALDGWASKVTAWRQGKQPAAVAAPRRPTLRKGRDVYVYFDNDVKVRAPYDAMNLAARFGDGRMTAFPKTAQRATEARRGVEEPRSSWEIWNFTAPPPVTLAHTLPSTRYRPIR